MKAEGAIVAGDLIMVRCGRSWRPGVVVVVDGRNGALVVTYWLGTAAEGCLSTPKKIRFGDVRGLVLELDTDHQRREFRAMYRQIVGAEHDAPRAVVERSADEDDPGQPG